MNTTLDFTTITTASPYEADRKLFDTPGKKKLKWFLLLILLPPAWPFLIVWLILKLPEASRKQAARVTALQAFAGANNFTYEGTKPIWRTDAGVPLTNKPTLPYRGSELTTLSDKLAGNLDGWQFEYLAGIMRIPPARPGETRMQPNDLDRFLTIFWLHTPVAVPSLFVNSKFNNMIENKLPLAEINEPYVYRLEGDFSQYYTVTGETANQIDIYTLLTPEVMQALIAHNRYDIWFHGNDVLLITYGGSRDDYFGGLPAAFETAQTLVAEVDRFARAALHEKIVATDDEQLQP
jgi:hypothetical protein